MSDPAPLDAADLVRRAKSRAGVEPSDEAASGAPSLGVGAEKLLVEAAYYHPAWKLPSGARLKVLRKAAVMPLSVYTDRQNQLNSDLIAAFSSLLIDCQALEARVARLEADAAGRSATGEADTDCS